MSRCKCCGAPESVSIEEFYADLNWDSFIDWCQDEVRCNSEKPTDIWDFVVPEYIRCMMSLGYSKSDAKEYFLGVLKAEKPFVYQAMNYGTCATMKEFNIILSTQNCFDAEGYGHTVPVEER